MEESLEYDDSEHPGLLYRDRGMYVCKNDLCHLPYCGAPVSELVNEMNLVVHQFT